MPLAKTFLPLEMGYPDPEAPDLGLAFPVLQTCLFSPLNLLLTCCVTLGKSLPLSGPQGPHLQSGKKADLSGLLGG